MITLYNQSLQDCFCTIITVIVITLLFKYFKTILTWIQLHIVPSNCQNFVNTVHCPYVCLHLTVPINLAPYLQKMKKGDVAIWAQLPNTHRFSLSTNQCVTLTGNNQHSAQAVLGTTSDYIHTHKQLHTHLFSSSQFIHHMTTQHIKLHDKLVISTLIKDIKLKLEAVII